MSHDPDDIPAGEQNGSASVEAIEADLARTRAELADTVDRLTAKLDVKTRSKERLHQTTGQISETVTNQVHAVRERTIGDNGRPTREALGAGGAIALAAVALIVLVVWRRRR